MADALTVAVDDLYARRHTLTEAEWLEAAPVLLGMVVAAKHETRLGNPYGGGDAAIAIGEDAFRAGWSAHAAMVSLAASGDRSSLPEAITTVEQAWSAYEPPEDIKELT